jgi:hypothetical protein
VTAGYSLSLLSLTQDHADYIDLNLGCPQRIAKRGYYGAFLMDNLQLVQQLVTAGASRLCTPVSVKIRLFPDLQQTIDYAVKLQQAGASLLAIHGRTRDQKVGQMPGGKCDGRGVCVCVFARVCVVEPACMLCGAVQPRCGLSDASTLRRKTHNMMAHGPTPFYPFRMP